MIRAGGFRSMKSEARFFRLLRRARQVYVCSAVALLSTVVLLVAVTLFLALAYSFKDAMKAKEEELKKRIDKAADAKEKEGEVAEKKEEAAEKTSQPESGAGKTPTTQTRSTNK